MQKLFSNFRVLIGKPAIVSLAMLSAVVAAPASADTVNVFTIGASVGSTPLDPSNNPLVGQSTISWTQNVGSLGGIFSLSILAEGIDGGTGAPGGGEHDQVFFNGTLIGNLTQQNFFSPLFNLQPGPGALAGVTGETLSNFDVTALVHLGSNTVQVVMDPNNWVNEVEVSTLTQTPLPGALPLFVTGLGALGLLGWRRKRKAT